MEDQLPIMPGRVDEAMRLAMKASYEQQPLHQSRPRYATTVMPKGMSEEEVLRVVVEASCAPPPPMPPSPWEHCPEPIADPPPPLAYPLSSWAWEQHSSSALADPSPLLPVYHMSTTAPKLAMEFAGDHQPHPGRRRRAIEEAWVSAHLCQFFFFLYM
jgi:hypothetical protein